MPPLGARTVSTAFGLWARARSDWRWRGRRRRCRSRSTAPRRGRRPDPRTALGLAVALGRPVALTAIRAGRSRPGLQPQHLTVVRALAEIADAEVAGATLGSTALTFAPRGLRPGPYRFDVRQRRLGRAALPGLAAAPRPRRRPVPAHADRRHPRAVEPAGPLPHRGLPAGARPGGARRAPRPSAVGLVPGGGRRGRGRDRAHAVPHGVPAGRPARRGSRSPGSPPSRGSPARSPSASGGAPSSRLAQAGLEAGIVVEEDETARGPARSSSWRTAGRAGASALGRRGVPAERVADEAVDAWLAVHAAAPTWTSTSPTSSSRSSPSPGSRPATRVPRVRPSQTVGWVVEQLLPGSGPRRGRFAAPVRIEPS